MGRAFEYRKARKFARWGAMSKVFTKIGKEIALSVKGGGIDPSNNPRLRAAIQNAKKANMPKTTVDSAIKKASSKEAENYAEVVYEGYGPFGIAILVETTTDNPTRTVANVRSHFNKCGGTMGTSGSVDYMFTRKGIFRVKKEHIANVEDLEFDPENTFAGKHIIYRAACSHCTTAFVEVAAHVSNRASRVIGSGFNQNGDAERAVAFVNNLGVEIGRAHV